MVRQNILVFIILQPPAPQSVPIRQCLRPPRASYYYVLLGYVQQAASYVPPTTTTTYTTPHIAYRTRKIVFGASGRATGSLAGVTLLLMLPVQVI